MKTEIYVLLINNIPLKASFNIDLLKNYQKEYMKDFIEKMPSHGIQILDSTENEITYHTGIYYQTDKYSISKCDILNKNLIL